jgi:hypothetical protein
MTVLHCESSGHQSNSAKYELQQLARNRPISAPSPNRWFFLRSVLAIYRDRSPLSLTGGFLLHKLIDISCNYGKQRVATGSSTQLQRKPARIDMRSEQIDSGRFESYIFRCRKPAGSLLNERPNFSLPLAAREMTDARVRMAICNRMLSSVTSCSPRW